MNVLVTGANGQLGNEMRRVALSTTEPHHYLFTDVEDLDITDKSAISSFVKENDVNVVVNCAAYTNVDKAETDVEMADLINHKAVSNLAVISKQYDCTLIHISTDYVFQGNKNIPCKEDWETNPNGVYGKTKLAGEQAIQASSCNHIIIRTAWLYSIHGKNFVKTMRDLTNRLDSIKVVFDQVGTPTYAGDLADLVGHIIDTNQLDKQGVYHYSNEGVCSWFDFATEVARMSNNTCEINPCYSDEFPSPVKRPHFSVLDKRKTKETFGVQVPYWTVSLQHCINTLNKD